MGYAAIIKALWTVSLLTDKSKIVTEAEKTWMETKDDTAAKTCQKSTAYISRINLDISGGGWVGTKTNV